MGVSIATAYGKRTPKWDTPEVTHIYEVMVSSLLHILVNITKYSE